MGKVIYLMVRVDQVSPLNMTQVLNWCHYSFDLIGQPIPNLEVEIRTIGNQLWAVFFRKAWYLNQDEKTPIDISDIQLKALLALAGSDIGVAGFRERTYFLVRLDATAGFGGIYSEEQLQTAVQRMSLYAANLHRIDSHLDPGGSPSFTIIVSYVDGNQWGAWRRGPKPEPEKPEEEPVQEKSRNRQPRLVLKPKKTGGSNG